MSVKLSPGVVIEARNRMVAELVEFGGRPIPAATRRALALADAILGGAE